jgi:excisionase family DNA binding protein
MSTRGILPAPASPWLDAEQASEYLGVSKRTLLKWARVGQIRGFQLSGIERHVWRFRQEDLDEAVKIASPSVAERIQ